MKFSLSLLACLLLNFSVGTVRAQDLYEPENLLAWCIVPFDARHRGPEERAEMLEALGFTQFAYDWRAEHRPTFDAEVEALQRHHITLRAWWFPTTLDADAQLILDVIARHQIHPQLWVMGGGDMIPPGQAYRQRVQSEAARLQPIAEAASKLGCQVGLYNHGGWFGEPEHQLEIIAELEKTGLTNVGIVYNFHHGHSQLPRFGELVRKMQPHLLAVNLNGMKKGAETILPLGSGDQELEMLRVLQASGWHGPIGIIDHLPETDSALTLQANLQGLATLRQALRTPSANGQAFFPDARPLNPHAHLWSLDPVNRDRMYDFYAKQAVRFMAAQPQPALLTSFPGLDSGRYGHWGNQNEEGWTDAHWNDLDSGGLQGGVVKVNGKTIPRAVCLRVGALAACFDPETLTWEAVWSGGKLVHFDSIRWGMMAALEPNGNPEPVPASEPAAKGSFVYHGYYRHGSGVVFAFAKEGVEWLETASEEGGKLVRRRVPRGGVLEALVRQGGPLQWPEVFTTQGSLGTGDIYAVDTLPFPNTPWHSLWHVGGHDFLPNGDAVLSTFEGEVWIVSGIEATLRELRWKRFATGLSQPLGVRVVDGKIYLLGRDQLTCLHDLNHDGEADFYECYSRAFPTPVGGHDYLTGLETDAQGRFYFASSAIGIQRVATDGQSTEVLATGFRNPNGLAVGPQEQVIVGSQEGDWTPASMLAEITPGGHYGYGGPRPGGVGNLLPTLYFPRGVENSCAGQTFVEGGQWGLTAGSLVHLSWGYGAAFLILQETLDGQSQGCAVPLPGEFRSGSHRARFRAQDGQMYVTGCTGWGTYTPDPGCFQRLRRVGTALTPTAIHAHENGLRLEFSQPLSSADATQFFAQQWNYLHSPAYGSDEYSVRQPNQPGHDVLAIASVQLAAGGRSLFLEIPQLLPCHQLHLHTTQTGWMSPDLYFTLHTLGPAFTDFPGYALVAKSLPTAPAVVVQPVLPSPFEKGAAGRALKITTAAGLQFAQRELACHAGERISLTLENGDLIPHNWVLGKAGTDETIADLAERNVTAPSAYASSYVPPTADVLAHTRLTNPGQSTVIHFTAPAAAGDYPYLCTFPGHTKVMRGVLHVVP